MDFWGLIAWFFWIFVFAAYLMVLFSIIADLFRDDSVSGWLKAVWIIFLVFVPFLTALVYLIARGAGMQKRTYAAAMQQREAQDAYIRAAAGTSSPTDEITRAKSLLDAGALTVSEFEAIKARALAEPAVQRR